MNCRKVNRRIARCSCFVCYACILAWPWLEVTSIESLAAQPVVEIWLEPNSNASDAVRFSPQRIIHRIGVIESFDDKSIRFLDTADDGTDQSERKVIQLPSTRVIWVEPRFEDPATVTAIESVQTGDPKNAIAPLLEAINRRPPVWLAQWLSMHLWQAAFRAQRYPATLELVNQIDSRPVPTFVIGGLPIYWAGERMPPEALEAARKALGEEESLDATKLVAASWLVGNQGDAQAVAVLDALARQNTRPAIAQLSKILVARKMPPPAIRENRRQWQVSLELLPMTLVSGPILLFADRLQASGDLETSLELYLAAGVTPTRPHYTTNLAKQRGSEILNQIGHTDAENQISVSKPDGR